MKGSVYNITHKTNLNLLVYIGSTKDFSQRKSEHKHHCNNPNRKHYNFDVYKYIRANGGWENWQMTEIYFGSEYRELEKEILKEHFDECINPRMEGRTRAETDAEWYKKNKERLSEKIPCPKCGCVIRRDSMGRHQRTKKCINYSSSISSSESE